MTTVPLKDVRLLHKLFKLRSLFVDDGCIQIMGIMRKRARERTRKGFYNNRSRRIRRYKLYTHTQKYTQA